MVFRETDENKMKDEERKLKQEEKEETNLRLNRGVDLMFSLNLPCAFFNNKKKSKHERFWINMRDLGCLIQSG